MKINNINDKTVAILHNYILGELKYKNKTYNSFIGAMRQFINWLIEKKGYEIENPFIGITRRTEIIDKTIITKEEFEKFLSIIEPDRGVKVLSTGERKYLFRIWLKDAFQLALETGLRREEFMSIKFKDIVVNKKGVPMFIQVENFKVNRRNDVSGTENAIMKHIPITKGLRELIDRLGYETNKGSDHYLIAKEENTKLRTRIEVVSKAFSHFWQFTGSEKKALLKHLRKTYLTSLVQRFGEKATLISSHSGIEVLKKHYINDQQLMQATNDFSVFNDR